jgi:hypothetical protein
VGEPGTAAHAFWRGAGRRASLPIPKLLAGETRRARLSSARAGLVTPHISRHPRCPRPTDTGQPATRAAARAPRRGTASRPPAHSRGRQRRRLHCGSSRASERRHRPPPPAPFQPRTPALPARRRAAFHPPRRGRRARLTARHHLRRLRPPQPWPARPGALRVLRGSRARSQVRGGGGGTDGPTD